MANPADVKGARRCVEEAANDGDWRKVGVFEPSTATPDAQI